MKLRLLKARILVSSNVNLPLPKRHNEFSLNSLKLRDLVVKSTNFDIINQNLPVLTYNFKMQWEGVKQAREYLEELEKGSEKGLKVREDWLKGEKAWLTYSIMS